MSLRVVAALLAVMTFLAVVPAAHGQGQGPVDLSQIPLGASDLDGWTQTQAVRDETWDLAVSGQAPAAPSATSSYQTSFTRGDLTLVSRATAAPADITSTRFQLLQHNAVGQTPTSLTPVGDASFGYWEDIGTARRGTAVARIGNTLIVDVRVTGVTPDSAVSDDQIATWLTRMVNRSASSIAPFDWTQALPQQPRPWPLLLDQPSVGSDWAQTTGLELTSNELGGQVQTITAARLFERVGPEYQRTLTSVATAYASPAAAAAQGMSGPGSSIDAPALGDQATAFQLNQPGGHDAPTVIYTIDARHGAVVLTTQEIGVTWSLDSPDEVTAFAQQADARATGVLST